MSSARHQPLAYARLLRLPNVFTAIADPLAGWLITSGTWTTATAFRLGIAACLYTGGIVLNDWFDYDLDCRERPERPLPSGAISRRAAGRLGVALLLTGLLLAALSGPTTLMIASILAAMILAYNGWAKRFVVLGPLILGACRFANFLLGMSFFLSRLWWAPTALAVYVMALSVVARFETVHRRFLPVVKQLLLGIIVLDAGLVAVTGDWFGAAFVLTLLIPAVALSRRMAMT